MWIPDPFVLFLEDSWSESMVPRFAPFAGLRVIVAPWQRCQISGTSIAVRGAVSYNQSTTVSHPGTLVFAPSLIAVINPTPAALQHGAKLAYYSNALWGHCDRASLRWPAWVKREDFSGSAIVSHDPRTESGLSDNTRAEKLLQRFTGDSSPLLSRVFAPCALLSVGDRQLLIDGLVNAPDPDRQNNQIQDWLQALRKQLEGVESIDLVKGDPFPRLFGTQQYIDTEYEPDAAILYLDPTLEPTIANGDREQQLRHLLARRRSSRACTDVQDRRRVETGVGRACLVEGLRVGREPDFVDFTVLGIGVTPFSEGGFVEVGRMIDGKATVRRGWHRKNCADRLEDSGCRAGRVVAMFEVPGEGVQMLDGTVSPEALVVRAFRSTYRVKNLDPLACCLHSMQHAPLVHTYVAEQATVLHRQRGGQQPLHEVELARALERHDASQESMRALIAGQAPANDDLSAAALVRQARIDAIIQVSSTLLPIIYQRLARDLGVREVDPAIYLGWFASCMGEQLARWRQIRFLHDYHHPGISRWTPGHIYTLGENNVSLLAEFPDLDTGCFVDDPDQVLIDVLQLPPEDLPVLRSRFEFFHHREIVAARTVVESLAAIMFHTYGRLDVDALEQFDEAYDDSGKAWSTTVTA